MKGDHIVLRYSGVWYEYAIYYPGSDEPEYDGIHDGGIKGIRDDAPEIAKKSFEKDMKAFKDAERRGEKL